MTIFGSRPTYRSEIKETYRVIQKLRDFTKKKNPKLRAKLLHKRLGQRAAVTVLLNELSDFLNCRALCDNPPSPAYAKTTSTLAITMRSIGESARQVDDGKDFMVRSRTLAEMCALLTKLKRTNGTERIFTMNCIQHRVQVETVAVYLWGNNI